MKAYAKELTFFLNAKRSGKVWHGNAAHPLILSRLGCDGPPLPHRETLASDILFDNVVGLKDLRHILKHHNEHFVLRLLLINFHSRSVPEVVDAVHHHGVALHRQVKGDFVINQNEAQSPNHLFLYTTMGLGVVRQKTKV